MFDIQRASAIKQEEEILLNYSCFVHIISVTKSEEYNIDYYVDCIFSKVLVKLKKTTHVKNLLERTTCINPLDEAKRLTFLGEMNHSKSQDNDALTCYKKSLKMRQEELMNRNEGDDEKKL